MKRYRSIQDLKAGFFCLVAEDTHTTLMAAQDAKEDVESSLRLLYDFTAQMLSFGPVLATKMSFYSTLSLPWGLGAAGAETVKRGVDTDNAEGTRIHAADCTAGGRDKQTFSWNETHHCQSSGIPASCSPDS